MQISFAINQDFDLFLNHLPNQAYRVDRNHKFLSGNSLFLSYFDAMTDAPTGRSLSRIIGVELYETYAPYLDDGLNGDRATFEVEYQHPRLAGC